MKVICISGKAQSGKDMAAKYLKQDMVRHGKKVKIIHLADLLKYVCQTFLNWNGKKNEIGRQLLQTVGTNIVRKQNPDYWVDFVISILNIFPKNWDYILIPDCRFPNEIDKLKSAGFDVYSVRIIRDNFENGLTEEQKKHESETALDDYKFDYTIRNEDLLEFWESLEKIALEILYANDTRKEGDV